MRIRNIVFGVAIVSVSALAAGARAAVLVELFTAQGCSTCPPADRLLSAMGSDPDLSKQVVPLAFHVDYWNTTSWHDRFSDAAWTKRQNDYVIDAGGTQVYTPQLVIAGGKQCIGSDVNCIKGGVEAAAAQPQGAVSIVPTTRGDQVDVAVTAQLPAGQRALDVMVALYESNLDTEVSGGENAHKTLHDDYVVRHLQRAFKLSGAGEKKDSVTLRLDKDWKRGNLGVAVFLQDPKSHQVYGAASAQVPSS
ncbi:MAG TPA: DUF1223 domain-containing protein [Thermoanaerobaculia bacterium]|jgi:hypothetical protein|nr:DUF1223 domain-containing protein [Thermoanaerobaculia bacterium]